MYFSLIFIFWFVGGKDVVEVFESVFKKNQNNA